MFDLPIRRRHPYRATVVLVVVLAMVWAISGYQVEIHYAAKKGNLADVVTMLDVRRRFEIPNPLCIARAQEIALTAERMIVRTKIA